MMQVVNAEGKTKQERADVDSDGHDTGVSCSCNATLSEYTYSLTYLLTLVQISFRSLEDLFPRQYLRVRIRTDNPRSKAPKDIPR